MDSHLPQELTSIRVLVQTRYGAVTGRRAKNGTAVFLEIPYALPPRRFEDPVPFPDEYLYEKDKEYIEESKYGVQPMNDGQAQHSPFQDKVGLGKPSENPLFLNIVSPPSFPSDPKPYPVKVYIHGGFLQFGSPHHVNSQAQYVAAERSELWINIGYRLSVFGFLASEELKGNYGFKDQWLALEWIKANCAFFGGDSEDIQAIGLSAGAHSVHQLLHRASRLAAGQQAPFTSAMLQSNAILMSPPTIQDHHAQYLALCHALCLDPSDTNTLTILKDQEKVPWQTITHLIETLDAIPGTNPRIPFGTFRGCLSQDWWGSDTELMEHQRSGRLARGLKEHGVQSVVIGDVEEEWYLYSLSQPVRTREEVEVGLRRYFPEGIVRGLMRDWEEKGRFEAVNEKDGEAAMWERVCGEMLSAMQVHLPVRMLARDLCDAEFPVVRYVIEWTPEQCRTGGYVTHATDMPLWTFRLPLLQQEQVGVARAWLERVSEETKAVARVGTCDDVKRVLMLRKDKTIGWEEDRRWDEMITLGRVLGV